MPEHAQSVLEFGSRNINGSVRYLAPYADWLGVDLVAGDGVDIVGDVTTVALGWGDWDVVVCCEVLEHVDDDTARAVVENAERHLLPGGLFIATMAGRNRAPHSAIDGGPVRPGEFYRNVTVDMLTAWIDDAGFGRRVVSESPDGSDLYCWAYRL